jgi:cyclopropane fatty-acyl-phospholipid synthase-like methyltransferase
MLSINFYLGSATIRATKNTDFLTLPSVKFFTEDAEKILDAGCGDGKTTISVSKIYNCNIVSLDTFDSDYIVSMGIKGIQTFNLHFLEHLEKEITRIVLISLGILAFFVRF